MYQYGCSLGIKLGGIFSNLPYWFGHRNTRLFQTSNNPDPAISPEKGSTEVPRCLSILSSMGFRRTSTNVHEIFGQKDFSMGLASSGGSSSFFFFSSSSFCFFASSSFFFFSSASFFFFSSASFFFCSASSCLLLSSSSLSLYPSFVYSGAM